MKLLRYGPPGQERPAVLVDAGTAVDVGDALAATFGRADAPFLAPDRSVRLDELADLVARRGPGTREVDLDGVRIGPPVARPGRSCASASTTPTTPRESGAPMPAEPIVFMKAPTRSSAPTTTCSSRAAATKTDWEVELGVVIGATARYLDPTRTPRPTSSPATCVSHDVSERQFQLERGGQWVKGKSCETFNPLGPWLVTRRRGARPAAARGCTLRVNGETGRTAATADMIFARAPRSCATSASSWCSSPGDSSTPAPRRASAWAEAAAYLRAGDVVELEVEGLGGQRQTVRQATTG